MRRLRAFIFALFTALCLSGVAGAESGIEETPALRQFGLGTTAALGRQIYEQDRYAAAATDIVLARIGGPEALKKQGVEGWIVVQEGGGAIVRFVKDTKDGPAPACDVRFDGTGNTTFVESPAGRLIPGEIALFRARRLALASMPELCSPRYNTVVLPDPGGPGLLVYALAATEDPETIPVTGHYRFTMDKTGEKIEKADRLFAGCMTLPRRKPGQSREPVAYFVTYPLGDTPVETHVFLSLLVGKPFYVTTRNKDTWRVDKGTISRLVNVKP